MRRTSNNTGAIINSERAFSVLIALARGIYSARVVFRYSLGAIDSTSANKTVFSLTVRLNAARTLVIVVNSLYNILKVLKLTTNYRGYLRFYHYCSLAIAPFSTNTLPVTKSRTVANKTRLSSTSKLTETPSIPNTPPGATPSPTPPSPATNPRTGATNPRLSSPSKLTETLSIPNTPGGSKCATQA